MGKTVPSERLIKNRKHFSKSVMVSVAVSKTGKTKVHFIDKGTKVDGRCYCETLLQNWLLPDIRQRCGREFVFQQDGAPSHWAKLAVEFLQQNVPNFIKPSVWPLNSPDINPIDYAVWSALQQDVHRVRSWVWRISKTECWAIFSINNWSTKPLVSSDRDWKL